MVLFDKIGSLYIKTRKPDERIVRLIVEYLKLPLGSNIADIGAGTGNYSFAIAQLGYDVVAIEPSEVMRKQGKHHARLEWKEGVAEKIPLDGKSIDGVISTAAIHHFTSLPKAFEEMYRILKQRGRIVIFSRDHGVGKKLWVNDYFRIGEIKKSYPFTDNIVNESRKTGFKKISVKRFLIPHDIKDNFFLSGWRRPWLYLDNDFCRNISPLAQLSQEKLRFYQERLRKDLESSKWHRKYGAITKKDKIDGGYRFVVAEK